MPHDEGPTKRISVDWYPDDERVIDALVTVTGIRNRTDLIRSVLREYFFLRTGRCWGIDDLPPPSPAEELSQRRAEAGRKGAMKRWAKAEDGAVASEEPKATGTGG